MKALHRQIAAKVLQMPAAVNPEVSQVSEDLYRDLHQSAPPGEVSRDLKYGSHDRHRLDLYLPANAQESLPVLLFVHGGGYARGDKSQPGLFYYDNIGIWGASNGIAVANMTYRLAPDHPWPSGAQDIAKAFDWLRANAAEFRLDPKKFFLMGHSAGAAHAAGYVAGHAGSTPAPDHLAGCVLVSGTYDLVNGRANPVYFGEDASLYGERSSIQGLANSRIPLLLGVAEADPPPIQNQFVLALQAIQAQGKPLPHLLHADGHNHYTVMHHLGTDDTCVGDRILQFVHNRAPL